MKNKLLKIISQVLIYTLVLFFIGKIFVDNWINIESNIKKINFYWASLSLLFITLSLTFQSYIWHTILKSIQNEISFKNSFVTYFRSLITRYIPGGIWVFIARTYVTTKIGLSKQQSLYLIIIESILAIFSGSTIFILLQPNSPYNVYLNILAGIIILFSFIFLLIPNRVIDILNSIFNKKIILVHIKWTSMIKIFLLYIIQWFIIGIGIYFLTISFTTLPISSLIDITGIFSISWVIGFIVIITPSGFGIREIVLITLLTTIISLPFAILIALFARIIFIIGEVLNFLVSTTIKLPE